eukprot:127254-Prymnesium_polylepis.1
MSFRRPVMARAARRGARLRVRGLAWAWRARLRTSTSSLTRGAPPCRAESHAAAGPVRGARRRRSANACRLRASARRRCACRRSVPEPWRPCAARSDCMSILSQNGAWRGAAYTCASRVLQCMFPNHSRDLSDTS